MTPTSEADTDTKKMRADAITPRNQINTTTPPTAGYYDYDRN
jgi:hypothetical protein